MRCSQLSSTRSACCELELPDDRRESVAATHRDIESSGDMGREHAPSRTGSRSTNQVWSNDSSRRRATSMATRVFPTPPLPVTVSKRCSRSSAEMSPTSGRSMNDVSGSGRTGALPAAGGHVRLLPPPPARRARPERGQVHRREPSPSRDRGRVVCLAPAPRSREHSDRYVRPRPLASIRRRADAA